jgi:hypothetical protein
VIKCSFQVITGRWESNMKQFGFMHTNGDLEQVEFTDEQIERGELRSHISFMKEEGFTFMGEEIVEDKNKIPKFDNFEELILWIETAEIKEVEELLLKHGFKFE